MLERLLKWGGRIGWWVAASVGRPCFSFILLFGRDLDMAFFLRARAFFGALLS